MNILRKRITAGFIGAVMAVSSFASSLAAEEPVQYRLYKLYTDYNDYVGGKPAELSRKYGGSDADWNRWTAEEVEGRGKVLSVAGNDIAKDCNLGYELKDSVPCGEAFVMEFDMYTEMGGALINIVPEDDYSSTNTLMQHFGFFTPFFIPVAKEGQTEVFIKGLTEAAASGWQTADYEKWENWKSYPKYTLGKWAHVKISSTELSANGRGTLTLEIEQEGKVQKGTLTYRYLRDNSERYAFDGLKRVMFRADNACTIKFDNLGIYTWDTLGEDNPSALRLTECSYDYDTTGTDFDYSKNGNGVRKYGSNNLPIMERKYLDDEHGNVLSVTGVVEDFSGHHLGYDIKTGTGGRISAGEELTYEFDFCSEKGGAAIATAGSHVGTISLFTPFYIPVGEPGEKVQVQGYKQAKYNLTKNDAWNNYGVKYTIGEWAHVKMVFTNWTSDGKTTVKLYITDKDGRTTAGSMNMVYHGYNSDAEKIFDSLYCITYKCFKDCTTYYDNMNVSRRVNLKSNMCGAVDASVKAENNILSASMGLVKKETAEDKSINIVIAQYKDDTLAAVDVKNVVLPADCEGYASIDGKILQTVTTAVDENAEFAKVFVLEEGTIFPITEAMHIEINK